jgi:DNA-binding transcriptional LysR family regulator
MMWAPPCSPFDGSSSTVTANPAILGRPHIGRSPPWPGGRPQVSSASDTVAVFSAANWANNAVSAVMPSVNQTQVIYSKSDCVSISYVERLMIEVRQARYFLAVAESLHIGRAAEQLGMSQPPLSQAILQLERRLGVRLLDRTGRKVTLTETGRAFAAECRKLLAAAQHAQDVATQAEAGLVGRLRIGVVTSALSEPLLGTIATFRRSRPQVEVQVVEVDTPSGQASLLQDEIDIAVIRLSRPVRGLRTQPWRRDSFVIAIPAEHPLAADVAGPVGLARFADQPWVWLRRDASPDYHDQLMATCRRAGFSPDVRHLANSITTQLAMVAGGLGVTLVPNVLARSIQPPVSYRPLTDRADLVELSLVTRDSIREPLVQEFLRIASLER